MKVAPVVLLLAASALSLPERWLHNPRERTASAIEHWQHRDFASADRELDSALELAGENPHSLFNAGTGRLGAGTPGAAMPLLGRAAKAAEGDASARALRPEALYNLGNAHLAAGDPVAAAESYRSALRLRPDHAAAKHNLELALRQQQQREQDQQPQQGQGGEEAQRGGNSQPQEGKGGDSGDQGAQQGAQPQPQPTPQPNQSPQAARSPRLPGFDPQKDMSADQAAALLEAVENLEREQRRARAEQQRSARRRQASDEDW